ncbi:50S ribosomal protein L4 [Patescibacteria group bacterium]|nr:50S ribosomal protein L4 [Patescibacteria group bacterium]MBU2219158.1 50S ribosomal protein L4 [Patescibacteria group bacterium]MBU2263199.1 50S ribosomal protein L4 [Patescibacteria group bacterium]
MEAKIYNQKAEEAGKIKLPEDIFNLPWNADLVHQVVVSSQSNKRVPVAHAKGRSEVRGGGRKPWPQKGTGRARHGSIRSPIWVGGGVTHGPTKEKKYAKKINKKMREKAFLTILSQKLRDKEILFLDKIDLSQPKTKEAMSIISNIAGIKGFEKLAAKRKNNAIIVLPKKEEKINRSFRNIAGMRILETRNLNILDLLKYKFLIVSKPKESLNEF